MERATSHEEKGHKHVPYCGARTRRWLQTGLALSTIFGIGCITLAALIQSHALPIDSSRYSGGNLRLSLSPSYMREVLLLLLNLTFVKLSVRSSGVVHEMALKWTLAREKDKQTGKMRLEFNANLRFLQSSYNWWSANGLPANVIMALCLTISYASSSMMLLGMQKPDAGYNTILSSVALYVLGFTTLLQSSIAFYAIRTTDIPTWSQSPFDTVAILVQEGHLRRTRGRCMHALADRYYDGPRKPRERQEPLWVSHPQFRSFTMYIWMIVAAGYYWAFIIWGMMDSGTQGSHQGRDWNLIPSSTSNLSSTKLPESKETGLMNFNWEGEAPTVGLLWGLGILVGFQGGMVTTALTCSETIASIVSDERLWREAGTPHGSDPSPGPLKVMLISYHTICMHLSDPVLHWLFGLAVGVEADSGFQIRPVQILYCTLAATLGVVQITVAGKRHPPFIQPSTYGHLQTLVDLVDDWHDKMYWGHKGDGHAGTSDKPLPKIALDSLYGGFNENKEC